MSKWTLHRAGAKGCICKITYLTEKWITDLTKSLKKNLVLIRYAPGAS